MITQISLAIRRDVGVWIDLGDTRQSVDVNSIGVRVPSANVPSSAISSPALRLKGSSQLLSFINNDIYII